MGRTRRSGHTADEALPLQLHIVGLQKSVGPISCRLALATHAGRGRRPPIPAATRSSYACGQEVPRGRQDPEEAAEAQEAEAAEEARRVENTRSNPSCARPRARTRGWMDSLIAAQLEWTRDAADSTTALGKEGLR
jgi:hypothetical protein